MPSLRRASESLDVFQVACLALFLAIVVSRTVSLIVRRRINPIALRLAGKGWLGVIEVAFFAQVNLWAMAVVAYVLQPDDWPLAWVFGPPLMDLPVAKVAGTILIVLALAEDSATMCIKTRAHALIVAFITLFTTRNHE